MFNKHTYIYKLNKRGLTARLINRSWLTGRLHLPPAAVPTQHGNIRRPSIDLPAPRTPCRLRTATSAGLAR